MVRRSELTDKQFALAEDLLPARGKRGGRWNDHRTTPDGVFGWLSTWAQWRGCPNATARPRASVTASTSDGRTARSTGFSNDYTCASTRKGGSTQSSGVRIPRASAPAARRARPGGKTSLTIPLIRPWGRSRGGWGSKVHLALDGHGVSLAATISAGQVHESKRMAATLEQVCLRGGKGRPRTRPKKLAGDKGYSYPAVRAYLRRRGILPVIPTRKDQRATHVLTKSLIASETSWNAVPVGSRKTAYASCMIRQTERSQNSGLIASPKRVYGDSSRLVCEETKARTLQSFRFHHLCHFISRESEEFDERPHALFLTAARKSLGSC